MRRILTVAAAVLLLLAVRASVRTVHHNGANCGSLLKPNDFEQRGPAGTIPIPCADAHATDRSIAFTLVAAAGVMTILIVVMSRRESNATEPTPSR
jgi:hypothetical protein